MDIILETGTTTGLPQTHCCLSEAVVHLINRLPNYKKITAILVTVRQLWNTLTHNTYAITIMVPCGTVSVYHVVMIKNCNYNVQCIICIRYI